MEENSKEKQSVVLYFNKNSLLIFIGFIFPIVVIILASILAGIPMYIIVISMLVYFIVFLKIALAKFNEKDTITILDNGLEFAKLGHISYDDITNFQENEVDHFFILSTKKYGNITVGKQIRDKKEFIEFYRKISNVIKKSI